MLQASEQDGARQHALAAPPPAWGQQKPRTARLWRAASESQTAGIQPYASAGSKRRRLSQQPQQSSSCAPAAALFALAACFLVAARWAQGIKQQQLLKQPAGALMAVEAGAPGRHLVVSMLQMLPPGKELKTASGWS